MKGKKRETGIIPRFGAEPTGRKEVPFPEMGKVVVLEERMKGFCFGQVKYMVPVRQPSGNVK